MSLHDLLRQRFPPQEYAVFYEVPNATGARATRWADAVVMGLWPSRGLHLHGFEIKASRADWMRELKDPGKAEAIAKYCDRWSLLVADPKIVQPGELPPTWGLWALRGPGLSCIKEPAPLEAQPITRSFLSALARSAQKMAQNEIARSGEVQTLERKLKEQRDAFDAEVDERAKQRAEHITREASEFRATVAAFEEASGLKLSEYGKWATHRLGAAVKLVVNVHRTPAEDVEAAKASLRRALETLDAAAMPSECHEEINLSYKEKP